MLVKFRVLQTVERHVEVNNDQLVAANDWLTWLVQQSVRTVSVVIFPKYSTFAVGCYQVDSVLLGVCYYNYIAFGVIENTVNTSQKL